MTTLHRGPVGFVVDIDGTAVTANLHDRHRGDVVGHADGVSSVGAPMDYVVSPSGANLIVLRVEKLAFAEPREAQATVAKLPQLDAEPLRLVILSPLGYLDRCAGRLRLVRDAMRLPSLGAEVFPLTTEELRTCLTPEHCSFLMQVGVDIRSDLPVSVDGNAFLARHSAILGSTGQGKTHFVAALLQELLACFSAPRIVIFDINDEYTQAFEYAPSGEIKRTTLGRVPKAKCDSPDFMRIPYYALGREGLSRLLLPSERTQLPALRFALDRLSFVEGDKSGVGLVGEDKPVLFDDCRHDGAQCAHDAIEKLRRNPRPANRWPHMRALSCLAAEWYAIEPDRHGGRQRSAFRYGHISPIVNRVGAFIDDSMFRDVVDVEGGEGVELPLSWRAESKELVKQLFGLGPEPPTWKVHIINLSHLAQDLAPFVLGAILELYASVLFERGPGESPATLLVLEEAHHYLRQLRDGEAGQHVLAYERLAKEGRKFGLSLMVSTQRPSELSSTVLAQCGSWCVFRLTNEQDQAAVRAASEWSERRVAGELAGLARGQAVLFGAATGLPVRVKVARPTRGEPKSSDADFTTDWECFNRRGPLT